MCAFTCSPDQQLTTFCLTHLFAGLYITRTLATTDEFSKTWRRPPSGSRCAVCRSDTSPLLLPENALARPLSSRHLSYRSALQRLDHQRANDRAALLDPEKRAPAPACGPTGEPPALAPRLLLADAAVASKMYAPIQDPEAATDARDERAFGYWNHFR